MAISDRELDSGTTFALGAIVTELITNSLKHAYDPGDSGTITVSFGVDDAGATLTVADDGKGLPPGSDPTEGDSFGLMIARMMAEQINGVFTLESQGGHGTVGTVAFPL